ncbi:hypothetical protein [Catenovulum sp. 2E275]|uniref:hypothetical protein n=1 Tax=Catenovulum sp. 2E275 TaxID=2980497 RepID=UPI0021CFD805|nr:hypothetical protein [Catenovulum sp. 2E275]
MLKLNKSDEEILSILKEAFFTKKLKPLGSDDHLRFFILRAFFWLSVLSVIVRIGIALSGQTVSAQESSMFMMPLTFFFSILFLHINNKSENFSVIVLVVTWVSLQLSLYM